MSRAFTREVDDAPVSGPPELPISAAPNFVTPRGAQLIEQRLQSLDRQLREATDATEIDNLRREQRYWAARRASMQVVPAQDRPTAAVFGSEVEFRRGPRSVSVRIVGEDEADPAHGLIAWTSPLAQALEDAEPGDIVELEAAGRAEPIEIVSVRP